MQSISDTDVPRAMGTWLDPVDRMLLTSDGTVTTLLEACTGQPIDTRTSAQSGPATLDELRAATGGRWRADAALLGITAAERVIVRRVTLRGACSGNPYVFAESVVAPDRLPGCVAQRLRRPGSLIGRVLAAERLETRRDVVDVAAVPAGDVAAQLGVPANAHLARRTYTITTCQRPVMAITEWLVPGRLEATCSHRRRGVEFVADV